MCDHDIDEVVFQIISYKSMKLGSMVHIDHTNKFSPVAKMNYAYVGHRSRSK